MCILERWSFHQVDHWKRYVCASAFQSGPHTIVQRWPIRGEKRKWNKHTFSVRSSNECLLAMICLLAMMIFRVAVLCMSFGSLKTQIVFEKKFSSRAFFKQRFLRINEWVLLLADWCMACQEIDSRGTFFRSSLHRWSTLWACCRQLHLKN